MSDTPILAPNGLACPALNYGRGWGCKCCVWYGSGTGAHCTPFVKVWQRRQAAKWAARDEEERSDDK